jgi:hypothetical protein
MNAISASDPATTFDKHLIDSRDVPQSVSDNQQRDRPPPTSEAASGQPEVCAQTRAITRSALDRLLVHKLQRLLTFGCGKATKSIRRRNGVVADFDAVATTMPAPAPAARGVSEHQERT